MLVFVINVPKLLKIDIESKPHDILLYTFWQLFLLKFEGKNNEKVQFRVSQLNQMMTTVMVTKFKSGQFV